MGREIKRDESIDILRGIGIIFMIMGHSRFGGRLNSYKVAFNMPIFYFISGYLFSIKKYNSFSPYLAKKAKNILLPYCFFAVLTMGVCTVVNLISRNQVYRYSDMLKGIIWSNQSIFPITGAIWFLQCLFWVEIGYYFLEKYLKSPNRWLIVIAVTGIAWILSANDIHLPFAIDSALGALLFFHIGKQWKEVKKPAPPDSKVWIKIILWLVLLIINAALINVNKPVNPRTCDYNIMPLYYLNGIMGIVVYWAIAKVIRRWEDNPLYRVRAVLRSVGVNSMTYLGLNQFMIAGFFYIANKANIAGAIFKTVRSTTCVIVVCVVIYLVDKLINKTRFKVLLGRA